MGGSSAASRDRVMYIVSSGPGHRISKLVTYFVCRFGSNKCIKFVVFPTYVAGIKESFGQPGWASIGFETATHCGHPDIFPLNPLHMDAVYNGPFPELPPPVPSNNSGSPSSIGTLAR
jgi:hypothetical protein